MKFIKYIFKPWKMLLWNAFLIIGVIFGTVLSIDTESIVPVIAFSVPFLGNLIGDYVTFKKDTKSGILK